MAQVNKTTTKKVAAGAVALVAAAFCVNLLLSPSVVTQLDAQSMRLVTTEGTFKTIQGNGSRELHVFMSTDCGFCRRLEPELEQLQNVVVYRHLLPGHTDAGRRAAMEVWCAPAPLAAWHIIAAGLPAGSSSEKCDGSALQKNLELAKRLGLTSTPTIIYGNGHVSAGMVSASTITAVMSDGAAR
jgi:thiol:disulfide interchange protein DsbC